MSEGNQINVPEALNHIETAVGHGKGIVDAYKEMVQTILKINEIWVPYPDSAEHNMQASILGVIEEAHRYIIGSLNTLNGYIAVNIQTAVPAANRKEPTMIPNEDLGYTPIMSDEVSPGIKNFQNLLAAVGNLVEIENTKLSTSNNSAIQEYSDLWFMGDGSGKKSVANASHSAAEAIRFQFQQTANAIKSFQEGLTKYITELQGIEEKLDTTSTQAINNLNDVFSGLNFDVKVGNVNSLIDDTLVKDGYSSITNMEDLRNNPFLSNIDGNYHSANDFNPTWFDNQ